MSIHYACVFSHRFPMLPLAVLLLGGSCGGREAANVARDAPVESTFAYAAEAADRGRFDVMNESELVPLTLSLVQVVALGTAGRSPASVPRALIGTARIIVVDEASRTLVAFKRSGAPDVTIPIGSGEGSRLRSPIALSIGGDTIRVLDLDPARGIVTFDGEGHEIASSALGIPSSTVDFVAVGPNVLVATIAEDSVIAAGKGGIIWSVNPKGEARPLGCTADPIYQHSLERTGLFRMFRFFGVAVSGGRVFCRQPVTPVVHILDPTTRAIHLLRRAPPFYRRAADRPETTNSVSVNQFRATWTEHMRFYPQKRGFVSVYGSFDRATGRDIYQLFACDSSSGTARCGVSESPGMPLDLLLPDTLVVALPLARAHDVQRLGFYRLKM
jgi:hypothetical protein